MEISQISQFSLYFTGDSSYTAYWKECASMAYLDSFELVSDRDRPFITLRERSITFSKTAIEKLNYSAYVHMFIDKAGKKVAFQESEYDEDAIPFYKEPAEGRSVLVRIADKKKTKLMLDLSGVKGSEKGIRIYGEFISEEHLIGFDLTKPISKG